MAWTHAQLSVIGIEAAIPMLQLSECRNVPTPGCDSTVPPLVGNAENCNLLQSVHGLRIAELRIAFICRRCVRCHTKWSGPVGWVRKESKYMNLQPEREVACCIWLRLVVWLQHRECSCFYGDSTLLAGVGNLSLILYVLDLLFKWKS